MKLIRKAIRQLGEKVCPSLLAKLNVWRAERLDYKHWSLRIAEVLTCQDNKRLPRVSNAGQIMNGIQVMHNGIKVAVDSYYGEGGTRMLKANKGCHEPQEEVVFDDVIRSLPNGATMIELGAYWSFYSIWFCKVIPNAKTFLVEPEANNLAVGQRNFELNGNHGNFTQAYIGELNSTESSGSRTITLESFFAEKELDHAHVVHADIQGYELMMLEGAKRLLEERRIDYLFISTHSMDLHQQCKDALAEHGYLIATSIDLKETFSYDGILLAHSPLVTPPALIHPSSKSYSH